MHSRDTSANPPTMERHEEPFQASLQAFSIAQARGPTRPGLQSSQAGSGQLREDHPGGRRNYIAHWSSLSQVYYYPSLGEDVRNRPAATTGNVPPKGDQFTPSVLTLPSPHRRNPAVGLRS